MFAVQKYGNIKNSPNLNGNNNSLEFTISVNQTSDFNLRFLLSA